MGIYSEEFCKLSDLLRLVLQFSVPANLSGHTSWENLALPQTLNLLDDNVGAHLPLKKLQDF